MTFSSCRIICPVMVNVFERKSQCLRWQQLSWPDLHDSCWQLLASCGSWTVSWCYLRPVRGCTSGGCVTACGAIICLGLLTFVLDLANSSRMVWGRSGSNLTPCCKKNRVSDMVRCQNHNIGVREREVHRYTGLKLCTGAPGFDSTLVRRASTVHLYTIQRNFGL